MSDLILKSAPTCFECGNSHSVWLDVAEGPAPNVEWYTQGPLTLGVVCGSLCESYSLRCRNHPTQTTPIWELRPVSVEQVAQKSHSQKQVVARMAALSAAIPAIPNPYNPTWLYTVHNYLIGIRVCLCLDADANERSRMPLCSCDVARVPRLGSGRVAAL